MVAVDCMSRYLRAQPLKSKYATSTAEAFKEMIKTNKPQKFGQIKAQDSKVHSKIYLRKKASEHIQQGVEKVHFRGEKHSITREFDLSVFR